MSLDQASSSPPAPTVSSAPVATPAATEITGASAASSLCLVYAGVYACGALYLVPSALAWRRLWRNRFRDATAVRLYALLGTGTLLRAAMFLLVAAWMFLVFRSHALGALQQQQADLLHLSYLQLVFLWQLLGMLTTSVLGGVFLLVFNTWASMVEQVDGDESSSSGGGGRNASLGLGSGGSIGSSRHGRRRRHRVSLSASASSPPRLLFIKMAVAVALLQLGAFLFLQPEPSSGMRRSLFLTSTVVLACCWIAGVVLLPAYGSRMCALLGKVAEDADHRQRNVRRIAAIATVFCLLRATSLVLLAGAQYGEQDDIAAGTSAGSSTLTISELMNTTMTPAPVSAPHRHHYRIPVRDIIDANPAFFFSSSSFLCDASSCSLLQWIVMLEVAEFPLEWALLMALLCVLPSRAVLPSIRGYQPIPDKKWRA